MMMFQDVIIANARMTPAIQRWDRSAGMGSVEAYNAMNSGSGLLWDISWDDAAPLVYAKSWRELVKIQVDEIEACQPLLSGGGR